jgi:hypothetical protein
VLGREPSLAFAAMTGQAANVGRSVDAAAGPRMAQTVPKVGSYCLEFQADLDQPVASVL